jgi:NAD-dependent SIR2 family protein deacetylase
VLSEYSCLCGNMPLCNHQPAVTLTPIQFYSWRRDVAAGCQPNPAHYAIAALQRRLECQGRRFTLITQNVDRLAQAAGSTDVIELHGRHVGEPLVRCGALCGKAGTKAASARNKPAPACTTPLQHMGCVSSWKARP